MSGNELTRLVRRKPLPGGTMEVVADAAERAALAARFGISAIDSLVARIELSERGKAVHAEGRLVADVVQPCAISGEDFGHRIEEQLAFRFVPAGPLPDEPEIEIELGSEDLDEIDYDGDMFDLGEAVAQSLGLAIDPYAEGPDADAVRKKAGIVTDDAPSGPLAEALAALRKD